MHLITSQMDIEFFIYWYIRIVDSGICIGYKPSPSAFILPNTMILKLTSFNICHNFSILLITSFTSGFSQSPLPNALSPNYPYAPCPELVLNLSCLPRFCQIGLGSSIRWKICFKWQESAFFTFLSLPLIFNLPVTSLPEFPAHRGSCHTDRLYRYSDGPRCA